MKTGARIRTRTLHVSVLIIGFLAFLYNDSTSRNRSWRSIFLFSAEAAVDSSTLAGKVMFGYQGWFNTPSDGGNVGWRHWCRDENTCDSSTVTIDLWPDMSEYTETEATNLFYPNGASARLFSALRFSTVDKHVEWLQSYGLDGVFLQRFLGELTSDSRFFTIRNNVTKNLMAAAEARGRTFAIMYDVTGVSSSTLVADLKSDWSYLVNQLRVVDSSAYQHQDGKPVVVIWGLGFNDTGHTATPAQAIEIAEYFKQANYFVMAGVPFWWRTLNRDSRSDYGDAYLSFDALSPWSVGRYSTDSDYGNEFDSTTFEDKELTYQSGIWYAPVIWPGGSNANQQKKPSNFNNPPRSGGDFFRSQSSRILQRLRWDKSFVYIAMFDEVDEGTAMFKGAVSKSDTPVGANFTYYSIDGTILPSDYYLQLASNLTTSFNQAVSDQLLSTGVLNQDNCLTSESNTYRMCLEADGNLIIWFQSNNTQKWALGSSSSSTSGPFKLVMQADGNLVIYNGSSQAVWSSLGTRWADNIHNSTGPYRLVMQNDGNLVVYDVQNLVCFSAL